MNAHRPTKLVTSSILTVILLVSWGCFSVFSQIQGNQSTLDFQNPGTPQASSVPPPLTAKVTEVQGKAETKTNADAEFQPAETGATVDVNGQVKTLENGRVKLELSNGTIIRVAPDSIFTLTSIEPSEDGLAAKLDLSLGKIFIVLNGGSLDISTGAGVASVRGSYMSVTVDRFTHNVLVTCLEGQCNANDDESDIDFSNGAKVILYVPNASGEHHKADKTVMVIDDYYDWLNEVPEAEEMALGVSHENGFNLGGGNCAPNCAKDNGNGKNSGGGSNGNSGGDHNNDGHEDKGKGKGK